MYVTNFTTATVFAKNGTQVFPQVKDTNGNFITVDGNGNTVDTLNRTPVTKSVNGNVTTYSVLNSQGSTSSFTVTATTVNVNTAFGQSGVTEYAGSFTAIQKITLPDTTTYNFIYDSGTTSGFYGLVTSMTLRTGGQVQYGYTNFSDAYGNINRWLSSRTASGTWSYTPLVLTSCAPGTTGCQQQVTFSKPSSDQVVYTFTLNNGAWETQAQFYTGAAGTGSLLRTTTKDYDFTHTCPLAGCFGNAYILTSRVTTTEAVPSGNIIKKIEYTYDSTNLGNFSAVKEWNYYTGTPAATPDRETDYVYLTTTAYANKDIHDRATSVTVINAAGTQLSQSTFSYDGSTLTAITGITHHDDTNFGTGNTVRGNRTEMKRWVAGTAYLTTSYLYDTTGQLIRLTNPRNHYKTYSYADAFFTDASPPANPPTGFTPGAPTNAYVTQITVNETQGAGSLHYGYYFNTGKRVFEADLNLARIYHHYLDSLERETHTYDRLLINNTRGWTLNVYTSATQTDTYRGITDTTPSAGCVSCRHDQRLLDSFGHAINGTLANDPGGAVKTDTTFDGNDRPHTQSNPYRSTSDTTYGIETSAYDGLDRPVSLTHADSNVASTFYGPDVASNGGAASQLCSTSTYGFGFPTLTVDEAGKKQQKWVNAFNSVIEADEPDSSNALSLGTCYAFDALQNNTQIVQGTQTRSYTFDGISRQTSAAEPESGTTTYFYTASDGSVCSGADDICRKTDARGTTATYIYDIGTMKDRLITISYSDGTPTTNHFYDQTSYNGLAIQYPGDRRTGMSDATGQTAWSYDPAGHIITERRTNGTITDNTSYTYNVDGSTAAITYPSGRVVNYAYNNAQQATSVVDATSSTNYITGATYAPHGELASAVHGMVSGGFAGITESYTYNNRLQVAMHTASSSNGTVLSHTYSYDLGGGANNGNIASLTNNLNTGRSQSYTYDTMNRLASAQSQATSGTDCWGNSYGYDRFGNLLTMTVTKCTAQNLSVTVDGNNHISGMSYDAAGNLTNDGTLTYSWDAENRLKTTAGTNYKFDGDSLRVLKGTNDLYWYSAASCQHPLFGRTTSAGTYTDEFIHFNGQAVGYRDDTATKVYHLVNDHLGSARVMTNATGVTQFESDYYPHGAARVITSTKDSLLKFQGKQQDTESGLDNVRRMYSPTLARFLPTRVATVPVKSKGVPAPQSLNPSSLAASNPVVHPNSLISNFINILFSPTPTPGSEGNNPCADFGCYPGPPDFNFFDGSGLVACRGILTGSFLGVIVIQGLGCSYLITCLEEPFTTGTTRYAPQLCRGCFFQPCPITVSFYTEGGTVPITTVNTFGLHGQPNNFCKCSKPQ
jgi:YD repeat-containing protein